MAHLNHLSGLKRRFDHIKVMTDAGHEDYEPTMVLYREGAMGRSFMVPLNCMWKYMEPKANLDARMWDQEKFDELAGKLEMQKEMFRWVARAMLPRLAEGAEKARAKAEKEEAAIKKAFPDLDIGEDPFEVFASMLFNPPPFEEAQTNGKADRASTAPDREGPLSV